MPGKTGWNATWLELIWRQFGAAIDMLENALRACPQGLWEDRSRQPEFWYIAYHTLFWLDFYLSESPQEFSPPVPFGLEELDPAGRLPDRVYSRDELLNYLLFCREKCRATLQAMTATQAQQRFQFGRVDLSRSELLLYNLRHVQHHTGQLNLILRQQINSAPTWVIRAGDDQLTN